VLQRKLDAVPVEQLSKVPRHSSRLDQAISPEMSCGLGRAAASDRGRSRMVHRAHRAGQGLGGGEADPVGSLDRLAVDTLNKGPALGSKIVLLQQDKA
jgi:hypothetical protein